MPFTGQNASFTVSGTGAAAGGTFGASGGSPSVGVNVTGQAAWVNPNTALLGTLLRALAVDAAHALQVIAPDAWVGLSAARIG